MAEAAERNAQNLETEHKRQFIALVQAATFRVNIADKFGDKSKQFLEYNDIFNDLLAKWIRREFKINKRSKQFTLSEDIRKQQGGNYLQLFNTREGIKVLEAAAKEMDKERKGVGFIPLLIWAVIAIVASFTAVEIIDETTTTTQEQKELIDKTEDFCTKNNLSPAQCKELLKEQTDAVTSDEGGFFSSIKQLLFWGAAAFVTVKFIIPSFTSKKTATT